MSRTGGLNEPTAWCVMERCHQQGVLGPLACPLFLWCGGVGLGWFSPAKEPGEASPPNPSLEGCVGEAAEEGCAAHQINHGQKSGNIQINGT